METFSLYCYQDDFNESTYDLLIIDIFKKFTMLMAITILKFTTYDKSKIYTSIYLKQLKLFLKKIMFSY